MQFRHTIIASTDRYRLAIGASLIRRAMPFRPQWVTSSTITRDMSALIIRETFIAAEVSKTVANPSEMNIPGEDVLPKKVPMPQSVKKTGDLPEGYITRTLVITSLQVSAS